MTNVIQMKKQDIALTPAETALFEEVLPVIDKVEERLDESIDLITFVMMVRRLAARGVTKDELIKDLEYHYKHQLAYLESTDETEKGEAT